MTHLPSNLRTIREDHTFAYCVEKLGDARYADELTGHVRWRLARDPFDRTFRLPGRKTRVAFTEELPGVPVFRVFFYVPDADHVVLVWIEDVDNALPVGFDDFLPDGS